MLLNRLKKINSNIFNANFYIYIYIYLSHESPLDFCSSRVEKRVFPSTTNFTGWLSVVTGWLSVSRVPTIWKNLWKVVYIFCFLLLEKLQFYQLFLIGGSLCTLKFEHWKNCIQSSGVDWPEYFATLNTRMYRVIPAISVKPSDSGRKWYQMVANIQEP